MTKRQAIQLKKDFLEDFARTGNVSESCRKVGIGCRATIYQWQEVDDQFVAAFREAEILATERLEQEARTRATVGTEKPVFHRGEVVGYVAEKSDVLLMFLLKARNPGKYRDNAPRDINVNLSARALQQREADFDYDGYAADFAALVSGSLLPGDDSETGATEPVDPTHSD